MTLARASSTRQPVMRRCGDTDALKRVLGASKYRDGLLLTPNAAIDTYDDHRMAMSFAILGCAVPGITIRDPGCVAKTFPGFFDVLASTVR